MWPVVQIHAFIFIVALHALCLQGKIQKLTAGIGPPNGRKWPATLWKIGQLDLAGWQDMLSKDHVLVINMLITKAPHAVNPIQCPLWAERGECVSNQQFMCSQCAASCWTQCAGFSSMSGLLLPMVATWFVGGFVFLKLRRR